MESERRHADNVQNMVDCLPKRNVKFCVGDRVVIVKNEYDERIMPELSLVEGIAGHVKEVLHNGNVLRVKLEIRVKGVSNYDEWWTNGIGWHFLENELEHID